MFERLKEKNFDITMLHHAEAILRHDMGQATQDIEEVLCGVSIPAEELVRGGGGEGQLTQRIRRALHEKGWSKHSFEIQKIVDGVEKESISHEIDHVKRFEAGTFALELEWNNKDPFFDRDLENFKRLHADGVISVGAIITRGKSLQESLRDIIESFALARKVDSLQDIGEFYSPTTRQKELIGHSAERHGSFARGWAHGPSAWTSR